MGRTVVERPDGVARAAARRQGALELLDAAERRAEDDRHSLGRGGDDGAGQEVLGCGQQDLRGATPCPAALRQGPQLLELAPAAHAQILHGEALDHRDAVASRDEPGPERVEVGAERGHGSGGHQGDGLSAQVPGSRHDEGRVVS